MSTDDEIKIAFHVAELRERASRHEFMGENRYYAAHVRLGHTNAAARLRRLAELIENCGG